MIGEAAAASGAEHGEAIGIEELLVARARAGGVEGRMLEQPDQLARGTARDRFGAVLHRAHRVGVGDRAWTHRPRDGGADGGTAAVSYRVMALGVAHIPYLGAAPSAWLGHG